MARDSQPPTAPGPRLHSPADRQRLAAGPTPGAIAAFGVDERRLRVFRGGQRNTWTDDRIVLKSVGFEPERVWVSEVCAAWTSHDAVRVPEPVPAQVADTASVSATWVVDAWSAHVFVPG